MAKTTISVQTLTMNDAGADKADADGVVADVLADGWQITPVASGLIPADPSRLLLEFLDDGSGATITIAAGVYPPASLAALGALTFTLAASDVKKIWLEYARFAQADGKIYVTSSDAGTKLAAFQLARGD